MKVHFFPSRDRKLLSPPLVETSRVYGVQVVAPKDTNADC
jgi:hypothetical protein